MPTLTLGDDKIEYDVRNSNRASNVRIDAGLTGITVVIPNGYDFEPSKFLRENASWVKSKKEKYEAYLDRIPERQFEEGASFPYLNEQHTIKIERGRRPEVKGDNLVLPQHLVEQTSVKQQLETLYRRKARDLITEKVRAYLPKVNGDYEKLYIRNQKTRWGSCSSKGNLNFNWRLVMGPEQVVEYVVVHELVHLEEKNHTEQFWRKVRKLMPDYVKSRHWLQQNEHKLVFSKEELFD